MWSVLDNHIFQADPIYYGCFDNVESLLNTYDENKRLKARLEDYADTYKLAVNDLAT